MKQIVLTTIAINIIVAGIIGTVFYWASIPVPIQIISTRFREVVTTPASTVHLEVQLIVNNQCPSSIFGYWTNEEDGSIIYRFPERTGGYTEASPEPKTIILPLKVPLLTESDNILPKSICYSSTINHYCGWKGTRQGGVPKTCIKVAP